MKLLTEKKVKKGEQSREHSSKILLAKKEKEERYSKSRER